MPSFDVKLHRTVTATTFYSTVIRVDGVATVEEAKNEAESIASEEPYWPEIDQWEEGIMKTAYDENEVEEVTEVEDPKPTS